MSIKKRFIFWLLFILIALAPYFVTSVLRPSIEKIEREGSIRVGSIVTESGNRVDIYLMVGDVFAPRQTRRDIGFDLVGVSCYFDPIEIGGTDVLITNPLLNSALYHCARDSAEFVYFLQHLFAALEQSRQVVACFLRGGDDGKPCAGDKITPFIWVAFDRSTMFKNHGVKYLSALPLFDPNLFTGQISDRDLRNRLALNTETAVRRLLGYSMDNLQPTVKSIGLAALGSTSHRGGDSRAFMTFDQGFLRSIQAIKTSKTTESLDRIYFVAFGQHKGVFREDALKGLQSVADYLILSTIVSPPGIILTGAVYTILWLAISFLLYQNVSQIWTQNNRWVLLSRLLAPNAPLVALSWGSVSALILVTHPENYKVVYWVNGILTVLGVAFLSYISKRFRVMRMRSYHRQR